MLFQLYFLLNVTHCDPVLCVEQVTLSPHLPPFLSILIPSDRHSFSSWNQRHKVLGRRMERGGDHGINLLLGSNWSLGYRVISQSDVTTAVSHSPENLGTPHCSSSHSGLPPSHFRLLVPSCTRSDLSETGHLLSPPTVSRNLL